MVTVDDVSYYPRSVLTCPESWTTLYTDPETNVSKCYRRDDFKRTWSDCYNSCKQTLGGSMVCPTSVSVSRWIQQALQEDVWIGYRASDLTKREEQCGLPANYYWLDTCSPRPSEVFTDWVIDPYGYIGPSDHCFAIIKKQFTKWETFSDDSDHASICVCEVSPFKLTTPDSSSETPPTPDSSSETPITPDSSSETHITPDSSSGTPLTPDSSSDTHITPDSSSEAPFTPDLSSETPITPDSSSETSPTPDSSSETPPTPDSSSETPPNPDSSSETHLIPDSSSESPLTPDSSSETPLTPDSSSETPPTPDSSSESPPTPDSSSETLLTPDSSSESPYYYSRSIFKVFNVSGIYRDFTFPSEVKTAKVQLWGAGGVVGAAITTSGGNGGAYVECVIEVKNKTFVFVVGESGKNDAFTD